VQELIGFAQSANVDVESAHMVSTLRIVAAFSHVDKQAVFRQVCESMVARGAASEWTGHASVDWETVDAWLGSESHTNPRTVCTFWLQFMQYVAFVSEPAVSAEMDQYLVKLRNNMHAQVPCTLSPLDAIRIALERTCGCEPEWTNICRTFLLLNVVQV
jgi:hypothetical protein